MTTDTLFSLANLVAMVGWIPMIFAPSWKWSKVIVNSLMVSLIFSGLYVWLLFAGFSLSDFSGSSLGDIRKLFDDDNALLAGWIHYLAFDLLVGTWIWSNARQQGVPHLLVVPCLFFTFMTGPFGFLLYWIIRSIRARRIVIDQNFS